MNEEELKRNTALTDYTVRDLNQDPTLPYKDNSFDVITNAVSVDYLTKPIQVFKEMHRVLKPGGRAIMSFSNRCFPTKGTVSASIHDHHLLVLPFVIALVVQQIGGRLRCPWALSCVCDESPAKSKTKLVYVLAALPD